MHKYLLVIAAQAFINVCLAQTDTTSTKVNESNEIHMSVEKAPEFINGNLPEFIFKNVVLVNIDSVIKAGIQGKVWVGFVVEKDGSISNVEVKKGAHPVLNAEAIRVVKAMPKWKPAMQNNKTVRCQFMLPIDFRSNP